jgi:hypothetical protein
MCVSVRRGHNRCCPELHELFEITLSVELKLKFAGPCNFRKYQQVQRLSACLHAAANGHRRHKAGCYTPDPTGRAGHHCQAPGPSSVTPSKRGLSSGPSSARQPAAPLQSSFTSARYWLAPTSVDIQTYESSTTSRAYLAWRRTTGDRASHFLHRGLSRARCIVAKPTPGYSSVTHTFQSIPTPPSRGPNRSRILLRSSGVARTTSHAGTPDCSRRSRPVRPEFVNLSHLVSALRGAARASAWSRGEASPPLPVYWSPPWRRGSARATRQRPSSS